MKITIFLLTHPLRGATSCFFRFVYHLVISTHTPLAGCNKDMTVVIVPIVLFLLTHPLRGATEKFMQIYLLTIFLLTHPLRGATETKGKGNCAKSFLLTHPLRGATGGLLWLIIWIWISTHTPLAGCNELIALQEFVTIISTHTPLAGCNGKSAASTAVYAISTHTPLAGCNNCIAAFWWLLFLFLLTHPLRGATWSKSNFQRAR